MKNNKGLLFVAMLLALSGCQSPPEAAPAVDNQALKRAIDEPLDKARAVEGELQKQQDRLNQVLEDQAE